MTKTHGIFDTLCMCVYVLLYCIYVCVCCVCARARETVPLARRDGARRRRRRGERREDGRAAHPDNQKVNKKTKRQRGFPDCSQSSTNAPQAGLSSLFRWGRLVFCWYERLMYGRMGQKYTVLMTCIGVETLMGHIRVADGMRAGGMRACAPPARASARRVDGRTRTRGRIESVRDDDESVVE